MKYYAIGNSIPASQAEDYAALKASIKLDEAMVACTNYDDAALIAKKTAPAVEGHIYPICAVEFKGVKGRHAGTYDVDGTVLTKGIYNVTPNETDSFVLLNGSAAHVDAKYKEVDLTAAAPTDAPKEVVDDKKADDAAAKPEDKKADDKKAEDTAKKSSINSYVAAAAGVAVVSTGFWFSGLYPAATTLLTNVGVSLPFAAIGVQVGVALAVGVAAVAVASLGIYAFNAFFGSEEKKTEEKKDEKPDTRTADQKYHDELKAKEEEVKTLSEKLTEKDDVDFRTKLHNILDVDHAEERKFKKDGNLTKQQPPANDKLIVVKYEAAKLAEVVAAKDAKERAELETKALTAAKADAAKKFAV